MEAVSSPAAPGGPGADGASKMSPEPAPAPPAIVRRIPETAHSIVHPINAVKKIMTKHLHARKKKGGKS